MADEVQRKIERRDGDDNTARDAKCEPKFALHAFASIQRQYLSLQSFGFFTAEFQRLCRSINLRPRLSQCFSFLSAQCGRQRLFVFAKPIGRFAQNEKAVVRGQCRHRIASFCRGCQSFFNI